MHKIFKMISVATIAVLGCILPSAPGVWAADTLLIDPGNGIVQEKISGRLWQKDRSKRITSFEEAERYAKDLRLGGYDDWRLPTIYELYDLHYLFDLHKNGEVQMELTGNYWSGVKDGEGVAGSWEMADQCDPSRKYYHKKWGYVRAVRP